MDSARTCWAEGMGLSEGVVKVLTLVAEESDRRGGDDRPELPADGVSLWAGILEARGWDDLAARAREAVEAHEAAA